MRILFLSSGIPYLIELAGQYIRIANQLRELVRRGHTVHILCTRPHDQDPAQAKAVEESLGVPVEYYSWRWPRHPPLKTRLIRKLCGVATRRNVWEMGYSPAFAARLRTLKSEFKPDIIHADSHAIGVYAKEIAPEPAIWFLADDDVLYLERRYRKTANSRSGLQLRLNIQARRRFLRRYLDPFSSVFFVADEDRATFLRDFPQMDVRVAANGIDLDRYPFLPETRPVEPASLLFTGNFVAPHNVDASLFFLRGVWPLLIKRYPNLCYYAAGANPPDRLREWHDGRRIHITGFVPSLQPYFERASVYVGSIVSGSGMLNKLQEAMAYGVPVVCTSIAARGLRLRHNDHVLVGDSPEEIASHVIRVLDKPAESRARAHRARRYMEEEYSWRTHVDKLESAYADALSGGRTAAGSGRHPCRDATSPSPSPSPS